MIISLANVPCSGSYQGNLLCVYSIAKFNVSLTFCMSLKNTLLRHILSPGSDKAWAGNSGSLLNVWMEEAAVVSASSLPLLLSCMLQYILLQHLCPASNETTVYQKLMSGFVWFDRLDQGRVLKLSSSIKPTWHLLTSSQEAIHSSFFSWKLPFRLKV